MIERYIHPDNRPESARRRTPVTFRCVLQSRRILLEDVYLGAYIFTHLKNASVMLMHEPMAARRHHHAPVYQPVPAGRLGRSHAPPCRARRMFTRGTRPSVNIHAMRRRASTKSTTVCSTRRTFSPSNATPRCCVTRDTRCSASRAAASSEGSCARAVGGSCSPTCSGRAAAAQTGARASPACRLVASARPLI